MDEQVEQLIQENLELFAENERLRAALSNIRALAAKRQHEGGPNGTLKAIEEFAVYGLEGGTACLKTNSP